MDRAESLMEENPELALTTLDSISVDDLTTKKDKARYALLMSMALDKNYIDTTTFDVLQPAIDYYLKKGNPDERLRTLYYQGRIFQNGHDDESALKCYIEATVCKKTITDSLKLAHTFTSSGYIYYNQSKYMSAIKSYLKGANIYEKINRKDFQVENLLQALDCYINIQDRVHADSLLDILTSIPRNIYEQHPLYLHCRITYSTQFLFPFEIKKTLNNINLEDLSDDLLLDITLAYIKARDKENATESFKMISHPLNNRVKYWAIKSQVEELNGDYLNALSSLRAGIDVSDSIVGQWTGDDRLFAENKLKLEKRIDLGQEKVMRTINYSVITVIALVILSLIFFLCFAKSKIRGLKNEKLLTSHKMDFLFCKRKLSDIQERYDQLRAEYEELFDECNLLKNENRSYKKDNEDLLKLKENQEKMEIQYKKEISQISNYTKKSERKVEELRKQLLKESRILDELIVSHITSCKDNLKQYYHFLNLIDDRKDEFLINLRKRISLIYPIFMHKLELACLSEIEIKFVCLSIIGLRPKEIGEFLQNKRFYVISSEIRTKLGLDKNDSNLGSFLKRELTKEE